MYADTLSFDSTFLPSDSKYENQESILLLELSFCRIMVCARGTIPKDEIYDPVVDSL